MIWLRNTTIIIVGILLLIPAFDYGSRYLSWKTFSKEEILRKIGEYDHRYGVTNQTNRPTYACLYVVECDEKGAKLRLVQDVEEWDIERTRSLIWERRFKGICQGRVTNLGLEFVSENPQASIPSYNKHARWIFYHDRFLQRHSRVQSGSFSQLRTWEPCLKEKAVYFAK